MRDKSEPAGTEAQTEGQTGLKISRSTPTESRQGRPAELIDDDIEHLEA